MTTMAALSSQGSLISASSVRAVGHDGEVQRIGGGAGWDVTGSGVEYREGAFLTAGQVGRPESLGIVAIACVGDPTGWQRIEGQRGTRYRCEVAVDVEDYVGRVGDVNADGSVGTRRHDGGVGLNAAIQRVQGGD